VITDNDSNTTNRTSTGTTRIAIANGNVVATGVVVFNRVLAADSEL
jgi:hypothetical protein